MCISSVFCVYFPARVSCVLKRIEDGTKTRKKKSAQHFYSTFKLLEGGVVLDVLLDFLSCCRITNNNVYVFNLGFVQFSGNYEKHFE